MNLSEKLLDIFSKAKTNKQVLLGLKNSAVHAQSYEFAKYIDDLILENFPIKKEDLEAKSISESTNLILRMVEINTCNNSAYRIFTAINLFAKKKGKFDIKDASLIISDANRIFPLQ